MFITVFDKDFDDQIWSFEADAVPRVGESITISANYVETKDGSHCQKRRRPEV